LLIKRRERKGSTSKASKSNNGGWPLLLEQVNDDWG